MSTTLLGLLAELEQPHDLAARQRSKTRLLVRECLCVRVYACVCLGWWFGSTTLQPASGTCVYFVGVC